MDQSRDVVVLSGVRTAIGRYGGSLKDVPLASGTTCTGRVARKASTRPRSTCRWRAAWSVFTHHAALASNQSGPAEIISESSQTAGGGGHGVTWSA
jgi:acetyl-CoA acetyltransferase